MFIVDCKIIQKTKAPQDNTSSFPPRAPPTLHWAGCAGHGRHPGCACKGRTKGLSLTERRLSFDFAEVTPRPEAQFLRLTARGN